MVCKNFANTTGLKILLKVGQMYDKFHCITKNKFRLLAPSVEGQENTDDTIIESRLESSLKNMKNIQSQHIVTKVPNKPVTGRASQACKQTYHSKHIGEDCQKHAKMCSVNDTLDDKYNLALQTKNKNKIKLKQASEDPTFQLWDQQNESKFGFRPLGPLVLPQSDNKINMGSDPIKLYDITRNQDNFNFLSTQIHVPSQLNPDIWQELLEPPSIVCSYILFLIGLLVSPVYWRPHWVQFMM